jgi:hypothetical protein
MWYWVEFKYVMENPKAQQAVDELNWDHCLVIDANGIEEARRFVTDMFRSSVDLPILLTDFNPLMFNEIREASKHLGLPESLWKINRIEIVAIRETRKEDLENTKTIKKGKMREQLDYEIKEPERRKND